MIVLVTYDVFSNNLPRLYEKLKHIGSGWWHYMESTWLIDTQYSADTVCKKLLPCLGPHDKIFTVEIKKDASFYGLLPECSWKWISSRFTSNPIVDKKVKPKKVRHA